MGRPRDRKWEKGQGALEFLIMVPVMFLMISLILYAGWWSYAKLSAQNAAYSNASWAPVTQLGGLEGARAGNLEASQADLREPIGMKSMWGDDIPHSYQCSELTESSESVEEYLCSGRLGGTGLTVAVSPRGLGWEEYAQLWDAVGVDEGDAGLPRGTAFFMYSPFMSGYQGQ